MSDAVISTADLSLTAAAVFVALFKILNFALSVSIVGAIFASALPTALGGGAVGFPRSLEPRISSV